MRGLINLYSDLENPNFSNKGTTKIQGKKESEQKKVVQKKPQNIQKKKESEQKNIVQKKPQSLQKKKESQVVQKKPQNIQKKKENINNKKSPVKKNDINSEIYDPISFFGKYDDPLSILAPKKKPEDNDDINIIPGKQDIKSKIDINFIENIIDNLNDKKYKYKSIEELQNTLKAISEENNLSSEESKSFLVYCWVAKNLNYYIGNKPDNSPLGALQKRITQCSGYARLFKELLKVFNIKSILVHGCGRTYSLNPKPKEENHEWNAIKLNGEYYLCEVTWGSGKVENGKFIPSYNTYYFCCPPDQFIQTHLPSKDLEKWQLLSKKITKNDFDNLLYKDKFFYFYGFTNVSPNEGVVKLNNQNVYEVKIENKNEIKGLRMSCKVFLEQSLIENASCIEKFDNYFLVHLIFNKKGKYNVLFFTTDKSGTAHSDLILRQQFVTSSASKEIKSFPIMNTFPDDLHIIEPKYNNLPKNKVITFKFKSNDIEDMGIVINKKCSHLTKNDNIFEGSFTLGGEEILVGKFTADNPGNLKVMFKYNIK